MIKAVLEKNIATRGGLSVLVGVIFLIVALIFSEGYISRVGFFGSLPYMYLEVLSEETASQNVPTGGKTLFGDPATRIEYVTVRQPTRIPLKYLLLVSSLLVGFGVYTYLSSIKKSEI